MHAALLQAAERLRQAQLSGQPCPAVRELIAAALADQPDAEAMALAYAVQRHNNQLAVAAGRRPVGRKIGLTSTAVQAQLGVDQPDFGLLLADMARGDGQPIAWADCAQPKVEAEIALRLGQPVDRARADNLRREAGKDTGTVRFDQDGVTVVADLPKRVDWDQALIAGVVERIRAAGDDHTQYVDIAIKVPERKYTAWPESIRTAFAPARTVRTGKPSFVLTLKEHP